MYKMPFEKEWYNYQWMKNKLFGNIDFYKRLVIIFIPIVIQNAVTSFVGLLDNIMVGQTGTIPMSGVSIANQLINIFNITTFGAMAAVGIFLTQYKGREDEQGVLNCFKIKLGLAIFISIMSFFIIHLFGSNLVMLYLSEEANDALTIAETLKYGLSYIKIMSVGLILFEFSQAFSSTMRECGDTVPAMISSVLALFINVCLNYVFIFGKFGLPAMGTNGAALATVISRVFELSFLVIYTLVKPSFRFLRKAFHKSDIPGELYQNIIRRGTPLLVNEIMYSVGYAATIQCYATRGITTVAAMNICVTVADIFYIACYAMGNSIAIMVGQQLGRGESEEAKLTATRLMFTDFLLCSVFGVALYFTAELFPNIYNTSSEVKLLAKDFLDVCAWHLPLLGVYLGSYFVLRSGGRTLLTFLFDGFSTACILFPVAFILSRFTGMNALSMYIIINLLDIPKVILGTILVDKGIWIQNIVDF